MFMVFQLNIQVTDKYLQGISYRKKVVDVMLILLNLKECLYTVYIKDAAKHYQVSICTC